ncbi:MAG: sulfite exporter TauE/SafE family protein [Candidatus Symbiobacter sp.]|nr:sulfite exporter TauE/SafE family protein [Candidatus Symbiobacter sp.]
MENLDILAVVITSVIMTIAYAIFGITGFGSSITAMPFLVQLFPLRVVVPIMSLLDVVCGLLVWGRNRGEFLRHEVLPIIPSMWVGMAVGVTLLVHAPERWLLLSLGLAILAYAGWNLLARPVLRPLSRGWSIPFSLVGGVFSALFGTGGPIYTIYLTRRIEDKSKLRTNISIVILVSGLTRLLLFGGFGLYGASQVQFLMVTLLPYGVVGLFLGLRLSGHIAPARLVQIIWAVLVLGGVSLVGRVLWMG